MDLRTRLSEDLKSAMRARDTVRTETIRGVRAAVLNREVGSGGELDDEGIVQVILGLVKQRVDSIEQYAAGGRQDLVDQEQREKELLESYLPVAPDGAQVEAAVAAVIDELGANGMKDMGRVMQACKLRLGPLVDGKTLSQLVKAALTASIVLMLACATTGANAGRDQSRAEWRSRLRSAIGSNVATRAQRDEHSRLLSDAVEAGALDGLNRDDVKLALGKGIACVAPRACSEQGFDANDWYYEVGVTAGSDVKQLPLLLVGFDPRGTVARVWTLTTH